MELIIVRTSDNGVQTIGLGFVKDNSGQVLHAFRTLELPYKNNFMRLSCVPAGKYKLTKRVSVRYGTHFILHDVPNRSLILIHVGNYVSNTKGCILVGSDHKYINSDNLLDVTDSLKTMNKLLAICPASLSVNIINAF